MNLERSLFHLALLAAALPAALTGQSGPQSDQAVAAAARALQPREGVCLGQPEAGGPWWALGNGYKARFGTGDWEFIGRPDTTAAPSEPICFKLEAIAVGGRAVATTVRGPERDGMCIAYDHGAARETVEISAGSVEQKFTFTTLAERKAIDITLRVESSMPTFASASGVRWRSQHTEVNYSAAIAIDADGNRCEAPTTTSDGCIRIHVPEAFVQTARLPLVIDPVVTSNAAAQTQAHATEPPYQDIAWDETAQRYLVVYTYMYSANDFDLNAVLLDGQLNYAGFINIDFTSQNWLRPQIASLRSANQFLVVAQVSPNAQFTGSWIGGCIVDNTLSNRYQFVIERAGVSGHLPGDKVIPDVSGNPNPVGPTYYTVVWECLTAPGNSDIHMKQVRSDGALVSAAPIVIAGSAANETSPAISKSCGPAPTSLQRSVIVWRLGAGPVFDLYATPVTWSGSLDAPILVQNGQDVARPRVSTITVGNNNTIPGLGSRTAMVVWETRQFGPPDLFGRCIDVLQGTRSLATNLTWLDTPLAAQGFVQEHAEVECDGTNFVVAFHQTNGATGNNHDIRVSSFTGLGFGLIQYRGTTAIAANPQPEWAPWLVSRYSSTGVPSPRYAVAWIESPSSYVWVATYLDATTGGFSQRGTGCGAMTMQGSGTPMLGETFQVTVLGASGFAGMVAGWPATITIPQCPACVLGVNGSVLSTTTSSLTIPMWPSLLGATISYQGFTFDTGGPCLSMVSLAPTLDVTIR